MVKSGIYSHPDVYIEDHINRCIELLEFYIQKNNLMDDDFVKAVKTSLALHDFGKFTTYFQTYIKKENDKAIDKRLKEHSLISGVYAFYCLKNLVSNKSYQAFAFVACKRHHTNPKAFINEFYIPQEDVNTIKKQLESINQDKFNIFVDNLNLPKDIKTNIYLNKEEFKNNIDIIAKELMAFKKDFRKDVISNKCKYDLRDFVRFQYIYSLILDADKTEAGAKPFKPKRIENINLDIVLNYKKTLDKTKFIDNIREEAFNDIIFNKDFDENNKIYSVTLPTGVGKTLIGLALALKLRNQVMQKTGAIPHIIYALPYVSIIDQNAKVYEDVLKSKDIFENLDSSILLKHHHLSEPSYEEFDFGTSRVLMEAWNSEIVVTTFVQLFHAMISYLNSSSRRFNKLSNAIVIIDEIQALPTKYWKLIKYMIKEISEALNTYFIFMTATQPYLMEDAIELSQKKKYIDRLNRYNVYFDLTPKSIKTFLEDINFKSNKTYLFINNTVASSKMLYGLLKEKLENKNIGYLSTTITPYERRARIKDIKDGKYRIVVSTQLVEAGVDIDFDIVYRDFAPMDSLNQSAGRCNRNMEKTGEFIVVNLVDENNKTYSEKIYDKVLLNLTKDMLKDKLFLSEKEFILLIEEYFKEVHKKISNDESNNIIEAIRLFKFDADDGNSIRDFELIEDDKYKSDVFVEINDDAKNVWSEAKSIIKNLKAKKIDIFTARDSFEKLKAKFFDYVIHVDIKKNEPRFDDELNMYIVEKCELNDYYDKETGFGKEARIVY
ncbi:CRISPR-associated helicase Cas3' [Hydrogenobaculum acidophilum]